MESTQTESLAVDASPPIYLPVIAPFKSERAAKVAMAKAERAYTDALCHPAITMGPPVHGEPTEAEKIDLAVMWEDMEKLPQGSDERKAMLHAICDIESVIADRPRKAAEAAKDAAWAYAKAVYDQARAQGFYVRSWHFGVNPTRDLIAANID